MDECFTLDQFKNFFFAKAFDIIGNGQYKKYLAKCKEANDLWAVTMINDVSVVQNKIRDLQLKINDIPKIPNEIYGICKDVMSSAQPPLKIHAGVIHCIITNKKCNSGLDFSKIFKGRQNAYVDSRFSHFFLLLWYFNKIEYIIRSCVRFWMDGQCKDLSNKQLCEKIKIDFEMKIEKMYQLCVISFEHVFSSLKYLIEQKIRRPILQP